MVCIVSYEIAVTICIFGVLESLERIGLLDLVGLDVLLIVSIQSFFRLL